MAAERVDAGLVQTPEPGRFEPSEIRGLSEPVRRYFTRAIAVGTPLWLSASFRMRGSIKVGHRWLRFRATQIESPHRGFRWAARAGGVIVGSDRYLDGAGGMDWRLLGLLRVAHAEGPDTTHSAAGRAAAEAIWVPTALLPRYGVSWTATGDEHITGSYRLDDTEVALHLTIDAVGDVKSVVFNRWGDPEETDSWAYYPFGFAVTKHGTFAGLTIPVAGRAGWHYGSDRWSDGEFFRSEITRYQPLGGPGATPRLRGISCGSGSGRGTRRATL